MCLRAPLWLTLVKSPLQGAGCRKGPVHIAPLDLDHQGCCSSPLTLTPGIQNEPL